MVRLRAQGSSGFLERKPRQRTSIGAAYNSGAADQRNCLYLAGGKRQIIRSGKLFPEKRKLMLDNGSTEWYSNKAVAERQGVPFKKVKISLDNACSA